MAYGVKFRLDFDDVLGNGKRLEILQDSYTGDVKSLVGTGDPVVIKWDADDDIYSPIIGSTCTINLFQTDDTDYDTFFNKPEKEYKVIISAAQTVSDIYKERVELDGGFVEAKSCIDSTITGYYDTESYFNKRVLDDGGVTESLDCIGEVLTVERRNIYTNYWVGWLITDQNSEVMAPNPQPITLKAIDGLGQLESFNPDPDTKTRIIDHLRVGLNTIGLELDILVNNDLRSTAVNIFGDDFYYFIEQFNANNFAITSSINRQIYDKDYNLFNYKEFLECILKNINAKIYQSNAKWVIANNSTYSEIRVQDDIQNILQNGGTLPTNIADRRKSYLDSKTEFTSFRNYDHSIDGQTTPNTYIHQCLSNIKTDIVPIDQSLIREFERGFKEIEVDIKNVRDLSLNFNTSFEYTPVNFTISNGSIVTNEIRKTGYKSFKITQTTTSTTNPGNQQVLTPNRDQYGNADRIAKFSYYFDTEDSQQTSTSTGNFWYRVTAQNSSNNFKYFDAANNNWTSTITYNKIEIVTTSLDKWIDQSITIPPDTASGFNGNNINTRIAIFAPYVPTNYNNYQALYIDNLSIEQKPSVPGNENTANIFENYKLSIDSTENSIITKQDRIFDITQNNFSPTIVVRDYTRFATEIYTSNRSNLPFLPQLVLQQQLNDYRETLTRYEGTLYNNNSQPLSMLSKVWVNFGENILQENNSCIMDGLEYNVKRNTYNVIMHIPNQDNDVVTTFDSLRTSVTSI